MAPFDRSHATFYWSAIVSLSCTIFELALNDIVTLKSGLEVLGLEVIETGTIRKLGYSFLFAFHRGSPSDYCHTVWCKKTTMMWLPDGVKSLRICVPACERRTDRHLASCDGIASRSKNFSVVIKHRACFCPPLPVFSHSPIIIV